MPHSPILLYLSMFRFNCTIVSIFVFTTLSWGQKANPTLVKLCTEKTFQSYQPKCNSDQQVVKHTAYQLGYNETTEQANWTMYVLSKSECTGTEDRSSKFYTDSLVKTGSATDQDYAGSGFDRGHLVPAGDMAYDKLTMKESFYYSNMSPQLPNFNRGIWKKLETQVRKWGEEYETLCILSGPVFSSNDSVIGPNKVAVPQFYYKIIVCPDQNNRSIAFLLPYKTAEKELNTFIVSIDEIEKKTKIDFFPQLPNSFENKLEKQRINGTWSGIVLTP